MDALGSGEHPRVRRQLWVVSMLALLATLGIGELGWGQVPGMVRGPAGAPPVRTENFVVIASDPQFAQQVARAAESFRNELAVYWLGRELPRWDDPCPITVRDGQTLGAGGETRFTLTGGRVLGWQMSVQGTRERILDSVLPHEITHTVLATHFSRLGKPVPRWADEGACTTVEHADERRKHDRALVGFLTHQRGISFARLFSLRDYPSDIMPLYAQGYSLTCFLIAQGGPRHFIQYLEQGMQTEDWDRATEQFYGYPRLGRLQTAWNSWVAAGGGEVERFTSVAMQQAEAGIQLASATQSAPAVTGTSAAAAAGSSAPEVTGLSAPEAAAAGTTAAAAALAANLEAIPDPWSGGGEGITAHQMAIAQWYQRQQESLAVADSSAGAAIPPARSLVPPLPAAEPPAATRVSTSHPQPVQGVGSAAVGYDDGWSSGSPYRLIR
jgi:hypothetical protein